MRNRHTLTWLTLICLLSGSGLVVTGCDTPQSQTQPSPGSQSLPPIKMKIKDRVLDIEVARTPKEHEIGLMKRDSMPENHGMIFVFEEEKPLQFWMKDTRIPLDIMYLDAKGKVVSVAQMQPYDLTGISSEVDAEYAIELNAGMIKKLGIKSGDVIEIPPVAQSKGKAAATQP